MRAALTAWICCVCWSTPGYADWAVFGAAARCENGKTFTLAATVELSSEDPGAVPRQEGYEQLDGRTKISCSVGAPKVTGLVRAFGPAARGMCMGAGYVSVDDLRVDGLAIFPFSHTFNWHCPNAGRMLTKVEVSAGENRPTVEVCSANDWEWGKGYSDVQCRRISVGADRSLNEAYARLMAALPEEGRLRLRDDQRAWLKKRDPQCKDALASKGAAPEPLDFLECVVSVTERRADELRQWQQGK
jgi:uncharacterized protein YecT (DUF1311 family)